MPNNVHGILEIINEKTYVDELNDNVRNNNNVHGNTNVRGNNHVGTGRDLSLPLDAHQHIFNQKNTPQKNQNQIIIRIDRRVQNNHIKIDPPYTISPFRMATFIS